MRLNRNLLLLSFLILFIAFSFQEGMAEDKVYFSCGSDSSNNGDTLYIPCNGTHDVRIRINFANDSALAAVTVPLVDHCYDPEGYAYLDATKNAPDSSYNGSRVEDWGALSTNIKDSTVLYGTAAILADPVSSGDGLFATMIYTVKDTGRICLDSLFFPPANVLEFVSDNANDWTPEFYADTFIIAARTANSFPNLTLHSNVDTVLTSPQTICIDSISATDPDAGDTIILEKIEGPGTFDPDTAFSPPTISNESVCFDPVDVSDTTYWFKFRVKDQCPAEVYDSFSVRVQIGQPPQLSVPDDVDTFLCVSQNLCIYNIIGTDTDAEDTLILEKIEGAGTFIPDTGLSPLSDSICFIPAGFDSTYRFIFRVTDPTLFFDEDTFLVSVDIDEPPSLTVPADNDTCLPPGSNLCVKYIEATDEDTDDTLILEMVSGPGTFTPDTGLSPITDSVCFDPASNDSTYKFVFKVTDSCDSSRTDSFYVTVNVNRPPVITLPADIDTFLCDPQEICFDSLMAFDPDSGDTFVVQMIEGAGTFEPDTGVSPDTVVTNHCFTPADEDYTYRFIFEVKDSCGETDRDTFNLSMDINEPPQISAPETLWVIENSSRTDTFTAADPDSNSIQDSAGVSLDPDCGVYSVTRISNPEGASGQWEISYDDTGCVDSVFTMIVDLRDTSASCASKTRYDTVIVIIRSQTSYNNSPIITVPGDAEASLVDTLELIFTAADPDSDEILDTSIVFVKPVDCGSTYTERLTPSGASSGEWKVTFYTEGCSEGVYWIDLNLRDFLGAWGWDSTKVTLKVVDVPETPSTVISGFNLDQNYPNPFNARTGITFDVPYACQVTLKIYNLTGQLVETLVDREMYEGTHTVFWDGSNIQGQSVASGIYFYKLSASDFVSVKKMIFLK
jgi:hypothetical protein